VREEKGNLKPIDFKYILGITSRQNITGMLDFSPCRVRNGERGGKTYASIPVIFCLLLIPKMYLKSMAFRFPFSSLTLHNMLSDLNLSPVRDNISSYEDSLILNFRHFYLICFYVCVDNDDI
jgi:hypothetical protein